MSKRSTIFLDGPPLPGRRRKQHWYIRGWSYEETLDRGRPKMSYHGEFYCMDIGERALLRQKFLFAGCLLLICGAYLALALSGAGGLQRVYVGACCILAIITVIYQGMGVVGFAGAKRYMTCRSYHAGALRLRGASWLTAILMAEAAVGETLYILLAREEGGALRRELCLLLCAVLIAALSLYMAAAVGKRKFELLSNEAAVKRMKNEEEDPDVGTL